MTNELSNRVPALASGAIAGLAGTLTMMAMRSFDQRYAPRTVAKPREDPGSFIVRHAEHSAAVEGLVPASLEKLLASSVHLGYGTFAGVLYSLIRGRQHKTSPLLEGAALGVTVYGLGYLGWLPMLGLSGPAWRQRFPQIAGGLFRHIAYGVTASAVYGAMNARR